MAERTCFVIQGFGKKQDFQTGRTLDLDASYEVIKEAVADAGLVCVRADEIKHSGTIDKPMYEQILHADVVVADLSTYNVNAAYELGVRHALRPFSTVIVAESQFQYPFDFSHIAIRRYEHLGEDVGRREALRFKQELSSAILAILASPRTDSPVYDFLPGLRGPAHDVIDPSQRPAPPAPAAEESSLKSMIDKAKAAMGASDFVRAKTMLAGLHAIAEADAAITQMLALATYKSGLPTPELSLLEARDLLLTLQPHASHDTETLGQWGAVHKRLWELTGDRKYLDEAVRGYERGFQLKHDYYNGINHAFLLNVRAKQSPPAEAIADWIIAERVRRTVTDICERELAALPEPTASMADDERRDLLSRRYWILATLREAAVGLGDRAAAARWQQDAARTAPAGWMLHTTDHQVARLEELLADSPLRLVEPIPAG